MHGELERKLCLFTGSPASRTTRSVGGLPSRVGGPFYAAPASESEERRRGTLAAAARRLWPRPPSPC